MESLSYWRWNKKNNDFEVGASLWEKLYAEYPDHFSSATDVSLFIIDSELPSIKQAIQKAHVRSDTKRFSVTTKHKRSNSDLIFSLNWKGEAITSESESAKALEFIGEVAMAATATSSYLQMPQNPEFYQQLMDNLPDSVFFKDLESRFIAINKACANKFALNDPEQAIGKTDFDFFNLTHAQQAFEDEQQIIKTGEPLIHKTEKEVYLEDHKKPTWTSTSKLPLYDRQGTIIGTFGISTNITTQKRALKHNKRLRAQMEAIFDSAPNLIFVKDRDGKYLIVNEAKARFHGLPKSELIGKSDLDLGLEEEAAQFFVEKDLEVLNQHKPLFIPESMSERPNGTQMWHQTIKVPFQRVESEEWVVLSIATDVTASKERELALNETIDLIGQQNKVLKNFAHIVSHNLRNHSGTISLLLEMFRTEEDEIEKEEHISQLEVASNRLKETIKDLNEIIDQQYQSHKVERELNLSNYVEKTLQILTTDIANHDATVHVDIPKELSFKYNPSYLESILLNLLSNALKYRKPDRKLTINIEGYEEEGQIHLLVDDNGKGINLKAHANDLFGMYKTFHSNEDAKGIGLFITKNQVESMGGEISVESTVGEGSSFHIRFN